VIAIVRRLSVELDVPIDKPLNQSIFLNIKRINYVRLSLSVGIAEKTANQVALGGVVHQPGDVRY
jgi:hypothetical protein